jgi:predicted type IV restriction endonuclease
VEFKVKIINGKKHIFDVSRKSFVLLTPEEAVRQSFLHLLIKKGYPLNLIKTEFSIKIGQNIGRPDIAVFKRDGSVFMIVECKAPDVKLSWDTVSQIASYNSTLDASYLVITNGKTTFVLQRKGHEFVAIKKLPEYREG